MSPTSYQAALPRDSILLYYNSKYHLSIRNFKWWK